MNLRPRQYYYNSYQISKNPLMDEKREKMINYSIGVAKKNLGMEYSSLGYNKVQDNDNNYNFYSYKMNRRKDDIYYDKINNDYSLFNKTRPNYHFNETYIDDKISFDYKIKMGKSETKNAIYLLKMANIIE